MSTTDGKVVQIGSMFENLTLQQHLILPLGMVSELLQHIGQRQVYLLIRGIHGSCESVTLEAYLRVARTSILLAAEG